MSRGPVLRRIGLAIAVLVLLAFTWLGLSGGMRQIPPSTTTGQTIQSVFQMAYGVFAGLSVATVFGPGRLARLSRAGWVVTCGVAGGMASVVWGGGSPLLGVATGVVAGLFALGVVWLLGFSARDMAG